MAADSLRHLAARVDRWHWLILALAAPFLLFPGADARLAALAVVAALWLSAWLARHEPFPITPFNRALLLFGLMLLVSLFATFSLEASLGKLVSVILGLAVLRAFACYGRSARGWWLCLLVFGAVAPR